MPAPVSFIKILVRIRPIRPKPYNTTSFGLKNQIGKAGEIVGEEAVQMHGGMGCTEEMSIGHYLKRLVAISHLFGKPDYYLKKYRDS